MATGWSSENAESFWQTRPSGCIIQHSVSQRTQDQLLQRQEERHNKHKDSKDSFILTNRLENANGQPLVHTEEAADLEFWARHQSWTFCQKCGKLEPRKLYPGFARRAPTPLHNACRCSNHMYVVPQIDEVPLLLRRLTRDDQRLLSPFVIHSGDYVRIRHGYRQRTGPFRITWCRELVQDHLGRSRSLQKSFPAARIRLLGNEGRQLLLKIYPYAFQRRAPTISVRNLFFTTIPRCGMACHLPYDFAM